MKLKRLKDEYINVRKELYSRIEENNALQHELVECRFKNNYNLQIANQTLNTLRTVCVVFFFLLVCFYDYILSFSFSFSSN